MRQKQPLSALALADPGVLIDGSRFGVVISAGLRCRMVPASWTLPSWSMLLPAEDTQGLPVF